MVAKARSRITRNVAHHLRRMGTGMENEKAKIMRGMVRGRCESAPSKQACTGFSVQKFMAKVDARARANTRRKLTRV